MHEFIESNHICEICDNTFASASSRIRHLRNVHHLGSRTRRLIFSEEANRLRRLVNYPPQKKDVNANLI